MKSFPAPNLRARLWSGIWRRWESNPRKIPGAIATLAASIALVVTPAVQAKCRTKACWKRVHDARAERWLWRQYKAHPMPRCTWERESGYPGLSPWAPSRYRARNSQSTAGGKFQILDQSWWSAGGRNYPGTHDAAQAPPLEQERRARIVLRQQGPRAWVLC